MTVTITGGPRELQTSLASEICALLESLNIRVVQEEPIPRVSDDEHEENLSDIADNHAVMIVRRFK